MNSASNSFIYYNGATFSEHAKYINGKFVGETLDLGHTRVDPAPPVEQKKEEKAKEVVAILDEDPVPEHIACLRATKVHMGIPVSADLHPVDINDLVTAASIIEKKKVNNIVTVSSTLKPGIYPQGFGNTLANRIGGVTTTCPRDNALIMISQPAVRNSVLPIVRGVHKALLGKSSPSFKGEDGLGKAPKMSRNYSSLEAFSYLQQARNVYGANEKGVRALSSGAAYCGLIDRHSRFQEHDLLCAINEYLSFLPKLAVKSPVISGHDIKYNTALQYIKIAGGSGALYNRLITNAKVPDGYGIVLDSPVKYDSAMSHYKIVCDTLAKVQYARTLYVNLPSSLPTQRDTYDKIIMEYSSRTFDFIGWLVESKSHGLIPLRSIHRGLVLYTLDPTSYEYQDIVNAMLMSNVYRNSWLLFPHMSYYEYMVARLNDNNTYLDSLKKTIIFNAPYTKTVKFIDTIEGTAPAMSDGSDFIPGGDDTSLQFISKPVVTPAQLPLPNGYWRHPTTGIFYPVSQGFVTNQNPDSHAQYLSSPSIAYQPVSYNTVQLSQSQPDQQYHPPPQYLNLSQGQSENQARAPPQQQPQYIVPPQRQHNQQVLTPPNYSPTTTTTTSSVSFNSQNDAFCTAVDVNNSDW